MKSKKIGLVLITGALVAAPLFSQAHQVLAKEKSATVKTVGKKAAKSVQPGKTVTSKTEKGHRIENNIFQVDVGTHGEIASLILKQDKFKTNYVMNENDNPQQATAGHQWVGELMFRTKKDGQETWQKEYTGPSKSARKIELKDSKVVVTYENATEDNGIKNMKIVETYELADDQLQWTIDIQNTIAENLTIGDFGLPLPFREFWTYPPKEGENESTTAYEGSVVDHSFVGQDASYIYATRPSGLGDFLVMTPDVAKGTTGFEYQDHWVVGTNGRTADEKAWCMDQAGWANGLNVFYIHSDAIKGENKGYLPNTALVLAPGETKTYTYNFHASDLNAEESADMTATKYESELKKILYQENIMDAVSVPGMVIPKGTNGKATGQMYLHTAVEKDKISFDYQCIHNDELNGGANNIDDTAGVPHVENGATATFKETVMKDGEQYHIYDISFSELGNNNIIVNYEIDGQKKKTTLQYYIIDDPEAALADHSQFLLKTQWDAPGELQDKVFDDWMMNTKSKRGEFGGYWGWGDDWGLVHGTYLAEMNSKTPNKEQVAALDEYLDVAIWNGLMQEHQEDFLIHDFLMQEPNNTPTYRGFAYPHVYNTYFAMYKIARDNPELIAYKESADEYLMKAYNIMEALYKDGVGYNWHTGVMGEVTTPEILQELKARGYSKEAKSIEKKMETKYANFAKDKYPYVSEYPYDNTSEEAIYMLGSLQQDSKMMSMVDLKTRACRGVQPIWYHYGNPTTICGENWFNFQYTASLAGTAMDDWLRNQENGMSTAEKGVAARANYAGKLANLTHINSGQISSDPENIGTVSWTYQAELGNNEALGTGGGKLHNGWRQMSGEADLALFGALQILSTDVVKDPIFGLVGYGGEVSKNGTSYSIVPSDGLRQRINLINEQLSFEVETDKFQKAEISTDGDAFTFEIENVTKKAHDLELTITDTQGIAGESYQVFYNGKKVGTYASEKKTTTLQVPISGEDGKLEVKKGSLDNTTQPTVAIPDKLSITLDEAKEVRLLGRARDVAWLQKQADPKWTVKEQPKDSKVEFSADSNEITSASFDKAGNYVLVLTANGLSDTAKKEVVVQVGDAPEVAKDLATYDFSITEEDIVKNTLRNVAETGYDSSLKGNKSNIKLNEGRDGGQALAMNGKIGGYIQLNPKLTNHVKEATATIDVKLKDKQVAGARIIEWQDTKGNLISLRFATENELEITAKTAKDKEAVVEKSGVSLLADQWRNLELTIKDKAIVLYVDGAQVAEIKDVELNLADFGEVQRSFIGRADSESAPWLNADVDNFTMSSQALSSEEIQKQYGLDLEAAIESLQNVSLVTTVKQAPKLPNQIIARYNNGTTRKVAVDWAAIDPAQYEKAGEFKVSGIVAGTDLKAEATVQVVKGEETNLATLAKANAIVNTPEDLGGVAGLNDGFEPKNSGDTTHGVWHNWLGGNQAGESWVEYAWDDEVLVTGMDSYYFFNGANFAPSSVRLVYMDASGKWQEFTNVEGAGVALDQYNTTKFDPVSTKRVRMYMNPVNLGTGVIEWKVYGYSSQAVIDKRPLSDAIAGANNVAEKNIVEGKAQLDAAVTSGQKILENKEATQKECDEAAFAVLRAYRDLKIKDNNWALAANVTVSYVSPWESATAINDGQVPAKSTEKTVPAYGSWGQASDSETLTYNWPTAVAIDTSAIYFWTDGGGILFPEYYTVEFKDQLGNWQRFGEAQAPVEADKFNQQTAGESISTKEVRVTMRKQAADANGVGVFEWQTIGSGVKANPADPQALQDAIKRGEAVGDEADFTPETWRTLQDSLALAKSLDQKDLLVEEAQVMVSRIEAAIEGLEKGEVVIEGNNLATEATIGGSFEDAADLGGFKTINDQKPVAASNDTSNGTWHNWNGRDKEPYLEYIWSKPVAIEKSNVYFFSDGGGIKEPADHSYEYLDENGQWQPVTDAQQLASRLDDFNGKEMTVTTTGLRLKMTPQKLSDTENHGVGVIEWQVFGEYVTTPEVIEAESIGLNVKGIKTLKAGKTIPLTATILPENATDKRIQWQIDKPEFAAIDEKNVLTGLKPGTTKITAITSNGKKASFTLRVTK